MHMPSVRCGDTAAVVGLINMLKVNLSSSPEIFKTMLAVLCDFDPGKCCSRERTIRYIRLLVSDKVLANCLLMSLPQGKIEIHHPLPCCTSQNQCSTSIKESRSKLYGNVKATPATSLRCSDRVNRGPLAESTSQNITIIVTDDKEKSPATQSPKQPVSQEKIGKTQCSTGFTTSGGDVQVSQTVATLHTASHHASVSNSQVRSTQWIPAQSIHCAPVTSSQEQSSRWMSVSTYPTTQACCPTSTQIQVRLGSHTIMAPSQPTPVDPVLPFAYHQFAYPLPVAGTYSYPQCLAGLTPNPLMAWSPLSYMPGMKPFYMPGISPTQGPVVRFTRHSYSGEDDVTIDLSMPEARGNSSPKKSASPKKSESNVNIPTNKQKGVKRSSSAARNGKNSEIEEPTPKVAKVKTGVAIPVPYSSNTCAVKNVGTHFSNRVYRNSTTLTHNNSTETVVQHDVIGIARNEGNGLQALQELTSKIVTQSITGSNLNNTEPQKNAPKISDVHNQGRLAQPLGMYGHNFVQSGRRINAVSPLRSSPVVNTSTACSQPVPQSNSALPDPCRIPEQGNRRDVTKAGSNNLKTNNTVFSTLPSFSQLSDVTGILNSTRHTVDARYTSKQSDSCQNSLAGHKSFPYSQHIQLPDGKLSLVNFPSGNPQVRSDPMPEYTQQLQTGCTSSNKEQSNSDRFHGNPVKDNLSFNVPISLHSDSNPSMFSKQAADGLKERYFIVESKSDSGKGFQIKLDKEKGNYLLGELLKIKPAEAPATIRGIQVDTNNNSACSLRLDQQDVNTARELNTEILSNSYTLDMTSNTSPRNIGNQEINGKSIPSTNRVNQVEPKVIALPISEDNNTSLFAKYEFMSANKSSGLQSCPPPDIGNHESIEDSVYGCMENTTLSSLSQEMQNFLTKHGHHHQQEMAQAGLSSCNVSPYILAMLPDSVPSADSDNGDNDDVFLDEYITSGMDKPETR